MKRIFTKEDISLFQNGEHLKLFEKFGAHKSNEDGKDGVHFALWAPNAKSVSVLCDANEWDARRNPMKLSDGIWECFIPGVGEGDTYRYRVVGADGVTRYKSDPFAFCAERRPANASVVADVSSFEWHDAKWQKAQKKDAYDSPVSIYEVHLGSWKKDYTNDPDGFLDYETLATQLAEYVNYMGYTHVEVMGICEYPFDGSWGYQVTGYFAPTRRHGDPHEFARFVDILHQNGIGVILDWVPAHFCLDEHGLDRFDGTPLYEYADPLRAEYPSWGTKAFDLGKKEVSSFLINSALFWTQVYHVDALRVDAVAAMLYRNFGRSEWRPADDGSIYNYESVDFFKKLNTVLGEKTNAYVIAEDSSIFAGVTTPVENGGLGFKFKWNMGWMNDTLHYIKKDPIYRKYHHGEFTHTADYAFTEQFMLVLSHDEVVHLKKPMIYKCPGNMQDKFGCLKSLYTHMAGHPGKKLLFMGQEFAQTSEWNENEIIHWEFTHEPAHREVMDCVRALNEIYKKYPALHRDNGDGRTFMWINRNDADRSIISYIRKNPINYIGALMFVCNFTPVDYPEFSVGAPKDGEYNVIFSTYPDDRGAFKAEAEMCDGQPYRVKFPLRAYESVILELPHSNGKK